MWCWWLIFDVGAELSMLVTWLVTNVQILSPAHLVSNIRHQHPCNQVELHHLASIESCSAIYYSCFKIYYGITQFCLFGSIGIVTITAFDRFLTIKSSNLSTRRFRYHLYSVFILLFSGKNSSLFSFEKVFSVLMTGPLFMKTQVIDYENDVGDIECKINWSSLRWILFCTFSWKKWRNRIDLIDVGDKMLWWQLVVTDKLIMLQSPTSL